LAKANGGSLTINPETGLPEAGFLQRILPAVLGAGLTVASGGALTPLMAAGLVGGAYGIAKGSLKEGLLAGLGAYGGAGVGSGLTAAGATTAEGVAAEEVARQAAGEQLAKEATQNALLEGTTLPADYSQLAAATATPQQIAAQQTIGQNVAQAGRGLEGLMTEQGRSAFMSGMAQAPYSGVASTMTGLGAITPEAPEYKKGEAYIRPYEFAWNPNLDAYNPAPTPGDSSERRYFSPTYTALPVYKAAEGGLAGLAAGGVAKKKKAASLGGDPYYKFSQDRKNTSMEASVTENFAGGGQALPPRFLSGGGDGMSDSIPATIEGKQEARLADGEFVIPADVVSHLGNGSSKAGAKKLYAMMDKIREARTGKTRQAPEVKAEKYMPA
jgi:hypothetical protein